MTEGETIPPRHADEDEAPHADEDGAPQTTPGEPDLPANQEAVNTPVNEPVNQSINKEKEAETASETEPDVLPAPLNALLACLWVLLFSGRWLLVPLLQAAGVLNVEQVAAWDEGLLYKTYLVLLFLTCIVLALRAARTAQKPKPSSP